MSHYLVAVVTPFPRRAQALRKALRRFGFPEVLCITDHFREAAELIRTNHVEHVFVDDFLTLTFSGAGLCRMLSSMSYQPFSFIGTEQDVVQEYCGRQLKLSPWYCTPCEDVVHTLSFIFPPDHFWFPEILKS